MGELQKKEDIETKYRWNAERVYSSVEAWNAKYAATIEGIERLTGFAGTLSTGPDHFFQAISLKNALETDISTLGFYASMRVSVDSSDETALGLDSRTGTLLGRYGSAAAFFEPEVLELGKVCINAWCQTSPSLAVYQHYFDNLFRLQRHYRSVEVESLLGAAQEVFSGIDSIHGMLVDSDISFLPAKDSTGSEWPVAQSTVEGYLASPDRQLRTQAWQHFCDTHLAFGASLAATFATAVKKDVFLARVRGFASSLDAALSADNIPRAVYERTLETFREHSSVWHRYWRVRARALGLERMEHQDIWAPLSRNPPAVTWEQSVDWISQAMLPLGKDYAERLKKGCFEDRWVDVMPTEGKGSGAFSTGTRHASPFIMMSWRDDLSSLSTLTHELGHSMHSLYTWTNQDPVYDEYSIFAAEVASNFQQAMTRAWLFDTMKDTEFQIALIEEALENFHRYFFIMPILALFEREVHERIERGDGLTASALNSLMTDLFTEGYGDAVIVDREREGSTWAQFGHLYAPYYVFQYATGISAAHAFAEDILEEWKGECDKTGSVVGPTARRYIEFISAGNSLYPVDALLRAGVDMRTPEAMKKTFTVLSRLIDRLEVLLQSR